jgi:hypothetical protein
MAFSIGDDEYVLSGAVMHDLKYTSKNIVQELNGNDTDAIEVCDQMYGALKRTMKKVIHQLAEQYDFEIDEANAFMRSKTIEDMNKSTLMTHCNARGIPVDFKSIEQLKHDLSIKMITFTIDQLWDMDKNTLITHCKKYGISIEQKSSVQLKKTLYALIHPVYNAAIDKLWDMDKNSLITLCKRYDISVEQKSAIQLKRALYPYLR